MNTINEMRKYAGLNEEYLTEGIRFFKNSNKINRLHKKLIRKKDYYQKKGKYEEAQNLTYVSKEIEKIFNEFKKVEDDFKKSSRGNNQKIKAKYNQISKKFGKLLEVTKQDEILRTLYVTGGIGILTGIILAGGLTLYSMIESGSINTENVNRNLESRARQSGIIQDARAGSSSGTSTAGKAVQGIYDDAVIRATNDDLMKTASVTGATTASVVSAGVLQKLKTIGRDNRIVGKTVEAIEDLSQFEKQKKEKNFQSGEGDDK